MTWINYILAITESMRYYLPGTSMWLIVYGLIQDTELDGHDSQALFALWRLTRHWCTNVFLRLSVSLDRLVPHTKSSLIIVPVAGNNTATRTKLPIPDRSDDTICHIATSAETWHWNWARLMSPGHLTHYTWLYHPCRGFPRKVQAKNLARLDVLRCVRLRVPGD